MELEEKWGKFSRNEREEIIRGIVPGIKYITLYRYSCQRKIKNVPKVIRLKVEELGEEIKKYIQGVYKRESSDSY